MRIHTLHAHTHKHNLQSVAPCGWTLSGHHNLSNRAPDDGGVLSDCILCGATLVWGWGKGGEWRKRSSVLYRGCTFGTLMHEERLLPALQQGHGARLCLCSQEGHGDQEDLGDQGDQPVQPGPDHPYEKKNPKKQNKKLERKCKKNRFLF